MFSAEKSERKKTTEILKYASAAQLLLGVGLFVCAIVAVVKQEEDEYYTYFIGGFTCGVLGAVAGILGLYTSTKASSYDGDDVSNLQKQLRCTALAQMILGYVLFMLAISGIMMAVIFLVGEDTELKIHIILAACIIAGIVLLLFATIPSFCSMGTCCMSQECQECKEGMNQTYPTTVGTTQYNQGQTAYGQPAVFTANYSTGGFNSSSNPPHYPVSQTFGMGQQQPSYGFQQTATPTAPPPYNPY
ncbi:uncharacterized protein LOC128558134 [Mercenaria mercenaria]|uniref:uncharacterized protein LOC128558134 n=1 Tax=Mercenaria mercenaria TaxID=6596 RepID=UPI00234F20DB|nr:uncharacterized protein LOC128558134 [Mercenaria mercenaria]